MIDPDQVKKVAGALRENPEFFIALLQDLKFTDVMVSCPWKESSKDYYLRERPNGRVVATLKKENFGDRWKSRVERGGSWDSRMFQSQQNAVDHIERELKLRGFLVLSPGETP